MLGACEKCWETICICGHDYKNRPLQYKIQLALAIMSSMTEEERQQVTEAIKNQPPKVLENEIEEQ